MEENVGKEKDWMWQQKNAVRDVRELASYFPRVGSDFFNHLYEQQSKSLKFQVTPYILSQIPRDISREELVKNPWYLQFFPLGKVYTEGHDAYNSTDNWEKPEELPTSNLHYKYPNRVLIRFRDCFGFCSFCFEALGVLEKKPAKEKLFDWADWEKSLEYIKSHPEIEEVIFSGGDPLLLSDSKIEQMLKDFSDLKDKQGKPQIKFKRIHTRALTINPFRITDQLVKLFKEYRINEIALNVAHSSEITPEFEEAIGKIREGAGRYAPLFVLHTPLLRGINDDSNVLWELFAKAYGNNIKPYYLLHTLPHTPYADKQRISVRDGIRLLKPLWRHKSHIALPEYVLVHYDGKKTVPLELNGTPEFQYKRDKQGNPIVKFLNWKGKWSEYPNVEDTLA
jgi:lysine 2,3-aminomutase